MGKDQFAKGGIKEVYVTDQRKFFEGHGEN